MKGYPTMSLKTNSVMNAERVIPMTGEENQGVEIKSFSRHGGLGRSAKKKDGKIKVYPTMLLKTKEEFSRPPGYPTLLLKIKEIAIASSTENVRLYPRLSKWPDRDVAQCGEAAGTGEAGARSSTVKAK